MNINKIEEAISRSGKPKYQVADECEFTKQTLSAILRGSDTSVSRIEKLAQVLDVPVGYFFGETNADGTRRTEPTEVENKLIRANETKKHLEDKIKNLEARLADKDKQLEDKERLIQLLMER